MSTYLPNNPNIYGIGERIGPFRLPTGNTYTIWNRGIIIIYFFISLYFIFKMSFMLNLMVFYCFLL